VQFDKTLVVVRERSVSDLLDLALQMTRIHAWPLALAMCLGALPLALLNHWMIGWMLITQPDAPLWADSPLSVLRFLAAMVLLVIVEAPLASVFATGYLGQAVFLPAPAIREVVREALPHVPPVAAIHLLARGVLPAWLLVWAADRQDTYSLAELLLILVTLAALVRRASAPFLNEILLLEKNPWRASGPATMTARKRSAVLHSSNPASLIHLAIVSAAVALLLTLVAFGTLLCVKGVFLDDWSIGPGMFLVGAPLALWMTAGYMVVVRFLAYLDLRIRQEGWEVELRMRAEGTRLMEQLP